MPQVNHGFLETNGIRVHIADAGTGPLVLLCHGFPESWYSWRHQIVALAAAGFHAVAPDMRGYGQTDRPESIDAYTLLHLVGDMVGVLDALGSETAVIVGHDWGAPVAWHAALMRPDRFRAVVGLSVPFRPGGKVQPTTVMPRTAEAMFYQLYFQAPGVAEADLEADVRASMRDALLRLSGDMPPSPGSDGFSMVPLAGGLRARMSDHQSHALPPWLSTSELDFYVGEFSRTGFRGGLNWYRNIDRSQGRRLRFQRCTSLVSGTSCSGSLARGNWLRTSRCMSPSFGRRFFYQAVGTGRSRNVPRQSMPPCWRS
jgi:pimeloyl-ACP methyl ester carboxylesterase